MRRPRPSRSFIAKEAEPAISSSGSPDHSRADGTLSPISSAEWTALGELLPPPPELVEGAGSALPPGFAWSQRSKGVLQMPGGYSGYLISLRKVCALVADERPTPVELASRLETVLEVKATAARLRESFLRKVGLISVHGETCTLGPSTPEMAR